MAQGGEAARNELAGGLRAAEEALDLEPDRVVVAAERALHALHLVVHLGRRGGERRHVLLACAEIEREATLK
jgi:hypothetical protein